VKSGEIVHVAQNDAAVAQPLGYRTDAKEATIKRRGSHGNTIARENVRLTPPTHR